MPFALNAQRPDVPDRQERTLIVLKRLIGPRIVSQVIPLAVANQITNFPKEWDRGWDGFGKRVASQYGQHVLFETVQYSVGELHHEDLRYVLSNRDGIWRRSADAIGHTFVVPRTDRGGRTLALGPIAASYGSWAIATTWNPDRLHTPGSVFLWGSVNVAGKIGINLFREFWPDVRGKVFHK